MTYSNGDAQWMKAGRGVIHEEMWDVPKDKFEKIEIFQLWINSPTHEKYSDPTVSVLKDESIPRVKLDEMGSTGRVLYGSVERKGKELATGPGNEVVKFFENTSNLTHLSLRVHAFHI